MKKKYDGKTALAKIFVLIKNHYENMGRHGGSEDIDTEELKQELLDDIEGVLNQTPISDKHLIIERLNENDELDDSIKGRWKPDGSYK